MDKSFVRITRILPLCLMFAALSGLTGCGGEEAPEAPAAPAAPAAATPTVAALVQTAPALTVPQLLAAASTAMREQRMVQPVGDNAIEYYLRVLDAEPENRQAQLAILELMPMAQGVTEQLIDGGRLDEAQVAVVLLKRASPTSVIVTSLEQRIVAQRRAAEQKLQAETEQAKLAEVRAREQAAAAQAAALAPATPDVAVPTTVASSAPTPARPATTTPARPAGTSASPPPSTTTTIPPTQVASAAPAASVASSTAPQNKDFVLTRRVDAQYPRDAQRGRTEGWVELSFTVTANGDVEAVEVANANPRRVFDREAIRALSQWKFSPRIENGKPVAARARQRLEFNLD